MDAGLFWQVARLVSVGAAGYNLVSIANEAIAPQGAGAGIGVGSDQSFQVTADWRADFETGGETTNRYAAGVEVLLGEAVPIRAGWMRDETLGGQWWSAGAGLVTRNGVALDFGYRQSLDDPNARTIAATLKVFLFRYAVAARVRAAAARGARPRRRSRRSRRARPAPPTPRGRAPR